MIAGALNFTLAVTTLGLKGLTSPLTALPPSEISMLDFTSLPFSV